MQTQTTTTKRRRGLGKGIDALLLKKNEAAVIPSETIRTDDKPVYMSQHQRALKMVGAVEAILADALPHLDVMPRDLSLEMIIDICRAQMRGK